MCLGMGRATSSHLLTVWIVAGSTLSSCSHCTRFWSFGRVAVKKAGDEGRQRSSARGGLTFTICQSSLLTWGL